MKQNHMKKAILLLILGGLLNGANAGACLDGYEDREQKAEDLWSGDCPDAWGFDDLCDEELIEDEYAPDPSDNPSQRSFK
mmetsp:Transcript_18913/g.39835  ORF Transcript_18913/g.39835 Transcript_18913/m.39835 type:complete len:80 (+) Transcript_18913:40-279(+)